MSNSSSSDKAKGLGGLGLIGFGIYGIGEVHGYLNVTIFIVISILLILVTSRFRGSRREKNDLITYNPNEFFILSVLIFITIIGIYSCYIISQSDKINESIAESAISLVAIIVVLLPSFFIYSFLKNRNDKITLNKLKFTIIDDGKTVEYSYSDIKSYQLKGSKLSLDLIDADNKTFDLSELNLNRSDIKKLDVDLQTRIKKITKD